MGVKAISAAATILLLCAQLAADGPRGLREYLGEFQGGMNVSVPRSPLEREDVERWASILNASDAQLRFMLVEYERFVERHNEYMDREMPRHGALCVKLGKLWQSEGHDSHIVAEKMRIVDQSNARIRRELTSLEHSLLDAIEPVLTLEQRQRLIILRHEATRRNCRTNLRSSRWSDVELREIWREAALVLANPKERQDIEVILANYEAQLTDLICQRTDLEFDIRQRLARNRIARSEGSVTPAEGLARYRRIMNSRRQAAQRVRHVHTETIPLIVEALSHEVASVFVAGTKQAAFPELYPNPDTIHHLFVSLASDEMLDADQRQIVLNLSDAYANEYTRICNELEAICIEWGDNTEAGITGYELQFLPSALEPKLKERTELSRNYLRQMHEEIGPDTLVRHADAIPSALKSEFAELLEVADETGN